MSASALALAACGDGSSSDPTPAPPAKPEPTATASGPDLTIFRDFMYPIAGACLPTGDNLMPNAPREYRGGVHEGVDFYSIDNCVAIPEGSPAIATKAGVVVRADHEYRDLTPEELAAANERVANGGANDFDVVDLFRGRQVWIDHGNGVVTRYAHLGGIPADIVEGTPVEPGRIVGLIGDSGTPESISSPGLEAHLHWELRAGDTYLGQGLPPEEVKAIYEALFQPLAAE